MRVASLHSLLPRAIATSTIVLRISRAESVRFSTTLPRRWTSSHRGYSSMTRVERVKLTTTWDSVSCFITVELSGCREPSGWRRRVHQVGSHRGDTKRWLRTAVVVSDDSEPQWLWTSACDACYLRHNREEATTPHRHLHSLNERSWRSHLPVRSFANLPFSISRLAVRSSLFWFRAIIVDTIFKHGGIEGYCVGGGILAFGDSSWYPGYFMILG